QRADELFSKTEKEVAVSDGATTKKANSSRAGRKTITIRQGDNLAAIARRNHTTVSALQKLNGLRNTNIRAGQKLRVK
ncbi:MAG: LysM peptidoglycan-binding domain-containing protein, partial [Bacteroidaceae bacterium]|nr:LysM peptidoglycan-binding domain-containing protein [Bacteroidaceae bacterium]